MGTTNDPHRPEPNLDLPTYHIDAEALGEALDSRGLNYRMEQHGDTTMVRTGFTNVVISLSADDRAVVADSIWRGSVPSAQASRALAMVNRWNLSQIAPTLRFFESQPGTLSFSARRQAYSGSGWTELQLAYFVTDTLNAILRACAALEDSFPEAITWRNPHRDHENGRAR